MEQLQYLCQHDIITTVCLSFLFFFLFKKRLFTHLQIQTLKVVQFYRNNKSWIFPDCRHITCNPVSTAGLQTSQDARFYAMSSRFDDFSNQGQPLVIQFTVKHEQSIDCGGGYIKLFPSHLNQDDMHGDSVYNIMFGKCG